MFNFQTLLSLPFGLIVPVVAILFFTMSKQRKFLAYDSIAYGLVSFLGSIVAVFITFIATNALFLSGLTFEDETSGLTIAGTVIGVMIGVLFISCESFKIMTYKKFKNAEVRTRYSWLGFSAGVVLAQNAVVFVALNIFDKYVMSASYAIFSGILVFSTSVMYTVLAYASESAYCLGSTGAAYALSSIYYLFWLGVIICIRSTILIYIVTFLFFTLAFVLGAVFISRGRKEAVV